MDTLGYVIRVQASQYIVVASSAVLAYDYLLTLPSEVELIWKARWSIVKIIFLTSRYSTFFDLPMTVYHTVSPHIPRNTSACYYVFSISTCSSVVGIGVSEIILVLRTYALWENSRKMLVALLTLFFMLYIPCLVCLALFIRSIGFGDPPVDGIAGCYLTKGSTILFADFAMLMLNETVIMLLTLWVGVRRYRHSRNRLVATLYRDGILYFVYLFLISAANIAMLVSFPSDYVDLLNTFQRVMHSILSCRIVLHVREASAGGTVPDLPLSSLRVWSPNTGTMTDFETQL